MDIVSSGGGKFSKGVIWLRGADIGDEGAPKIPTVFVIEVAVTLATLMGFMTTV